MIRTVEIVVNMELKHYKIFHKYISLEGIFNYTHYFSLLLTFLTVIYVLINRL